MTERDKSHYRYFSQLDRRIKNAIAVYAFFLLGGISVCLLDADPFRSLFVPLSWRGPVVSLLIACMLVICIYLALRRMPDVSRVNAWFDRRLFGLLDSSDAIMKRTILNAADAPGAESAGDRNALAELVVGRLSEHDQIYRSLFESGIFTRWAWYWISMYGAITFSALVIVTFCTLAPGLTPELRPVFPWYLGAALGLIALTLLLGRRLERMTRTTAETIASTYRADIVRLAEGFVRAPESEEH